MATVVVVTRDIEVRGTLGAMLAEHGISAVEVEDAVEVIARVGAMRSPPDLILVDRRLARGADVELLESIRSRASVADVPIVLFTAPGAGRAPDDLRDALDVGMLMAIIEAICAQAGGDA
jgi:DNA-binding response OmpR family regulator